MINEEIVNKENEKFVVKVYVKSTGQLVGAVICDDEDEAEKIAYEIEETNANTKVEIMTDNFENELWKEWAEDVERLVKYNYRVWGLNVITSEEYREEGFEFVEVDWSDAAFSEGREFLGWYDFEKDVVVDAEGRIVGKYDENGNFIRLNEGD